MIDEGVPARAEELDERGATHTLKDRDSPALEIVIEDIARVRSGRQDGAARRHWYPRWRERGTGWAITRRSNPPMPITVGAKKGRYRPTGFGRRVMSSGLMTSEELAESL